ncbi:hypothetical protein ACFRAR_14435 [Kitasatospora sp. NPDC056651]|uniref:hypothetical protein n=1 Tax=Kitasatospora sp. NPDC056651 TaxID=3345892 RepID=UPI003678632C
MVTHTLVFAFPAEMTEDDRAEFFREGSALVLGTGFADAYRHWPHMPLVDAAREVLAPVFTPSAMAQIECRDFAAMRQLFAHPSLAAFVGRWQARFPYQAVSVNTGPSQPE